MTATFAPPEASIDGALWPEVVTVPHRPLRAAVAKRLTKRAVASLPLRVTTADGERFGAGTVDDPNLHLIRPDAFYERLGSGGLIGFGEAFMAGDWVSDDLAGVLTVMARRMADLIPPKLQRLRSAAVHIRPSSQDNTVEGARQNIRRHYDLSNELFALFLDQSLTYSSALFESDPDHAAESLTSAQNRKIDRLLDIAGVGQHSKVLEIGTGWGELAIRAAARGAEVTSVTISTEQAELATKRVHEAGFADRVEICLQDYREVSGQFDAVVSVEMIEAVGANHWDEYFAKIASLLVPGGRVGLQAITMPHDRMVATLNTYTWIVKYIFPGGAIPSVRAIREHVDAAGLRMSSEFAFGLHYAETLRRWRQTFEAEASNVQALGFDQVFRRMWSLYLAYSEAGFSSRYLDVIQFGFAKPVEGSS
ncbi:class I SAM-dependent methyltransferase [Jatrophihabitans sp. DSM 45814]